MNKKLLTRISFAVFSAILLLSGCAPRPYTVKEVTKDLERRYDAKGRFTWIETLEEEHYLFYDNERDVTFHVTSSTGGWGDNSLVPIPYRSIYADLNQGIMSACREQAASIAENYNLTLIQDETEAKDSIYVTDFSQLNDAALLFFALFELYNLEAIDTFVGGAAFYYCENPPTEETRQNAIKIEDFYYCQLREGKGYLFFENSDELYNKLQERWRAAEGYNDALPTARPRTF
jgi:hypothetical protein